MEFRLLGRGWRPDLAALLGNAREEVVVASPFIKTAEAAWALSQIGNGTRVSVLTDISPDSVAGGSLDLDALGLFLNQPAGSVAALPRLHAKVFVADETEAIVTSGNLTMAGLDHNLEYGVRIVDPVRVREIRAGLASYARLGSVIDKQVLATLQTFSRRLVEEQQRVDASASSEARSAFRRALREARQAFLGAEVGPRSANAVFSDAILYALGEGPVATTELHQRVRSLIPELCNDDEELIINGERFGKAWKHAVRNAQQHLKRRGLASFDRARRTWRAV